MADEKNNPDDGKTVRVDPQVLKNHVSVWQSWGDYILESANLLVGTTIAPGDFPAAAQFKATVEKRIGQLLVNSINIAHSLQEIGKALTLTADEYILSQDDSKDDVNRAMRFATVVSPYLPGASAAVPATPGVAPPQPPAPIPQPEEIAK